MMMIFDVNDTTEQVLQSGNKLAINTYAETTKVESCMSFWNASVR